MKRLFLLILSILLLAPLAHAGYEDFSAFNLDWSGGNNSRLAFYAPLTSTSTILSPPRAYPGTAATFGRASAQYFTDYQGVIQSVAATYPAVEGSRVVGNTCYDTDASGNALPKPGDYPERANSTAYTVGQKIQANGWWYTCTTGGTSHSSAPTWATGKAGLVTVTDGTVTWTLGGRLLLGYVSEPASTNKTTAYGIIPADTLGSELITVADNRTFDSDTGFWTKADGTITISGGTANFANTTTDGASIYNQLGLYYGRMYAITYTISNYSAGSLVVRNGGVDHTTSHNANGTYIDYVSQGISSGILGFKATGFTGSIDNVSCKEVSWMAGVKSLHDRSFFVQNISGMTLSGDVAAVLSIVTDQTEIEKAGLGGINPTYKVYKLDNSAGSTWATVVLGGTTGNTNPHFNTVVYRGSGEISINNAGTGTALSSVLYKRGGAAQTPDTSEKVQKVNANAGQTIYFLLPQLEELSYATSIMPTSGATVTRAATSLSYPVTGNLSSPLWSAKITATPAAASQDGKFFLGSYLDANNSVGLLMSGANAVARKRIGGSNNDATKALTLVAGTTKRFGMRGSSSGWSLFVDGVKGTDSADTTTPVAGATLQLGLDGNSGNAFYGYLRDFYLYNKPLADGRFQ